MPNCVDKSLDNLKVYKNKSTKSDIFFAMSHGVHRGILKKGKVDQRETFINKLIKICCKKYNQKKNNWKNYFNR